MCIHMHDAYMHAGLHAYKWNEQTNAGADHLLRFRSSKRWIWKMMFLELSFDPRI